MKKYINYLLSLAIACAAVACTETVSLDDSVDNRVNKVINGYIDDLSTAENGWIVNVMTDEGIYRFWMDFTNNNVVTMYTDNLHHPKYQNEPQTSTYNIRSLLLPTLSFDTYSYIHIINDPDDRISFGNDNQGLNTDFEFEINGYQDGVFSLTGRISRVKATLMRATYDDKLAVQNGELMSVLTKTASYKKGQYCGTEVNGVKVGVMFQPRNALLMWRDASGKGQQAKPLTYTTLNRDVILDEPIEIGSAKIAAFRWNATSETYTTEMADGTTSPVTVQEEAVISLYHLLGNGKVYTELFSDFYMYATNDSTEEELTELSNNNAYFANYLIAESYMYRNFGLILQYLNFNFYVSEAGRPRLMLSVFVSSPQGMIRVRYSYQLMPNDAKEQFTVGTAITFEDGTDSQTVYNYAVKPLCDFLKGSTFQVEWSTKEYGTELMGQLRLINNPLETGAVIHGALY